MRDILPKSLRQLAQISPAPLYVVGGFVRDYLANLRPLNGKFDFDICSPTSAETFATLAQEHGFHVQALYKNTGTLKLTDEEGNDFEFSSFRSDKYVRGVHAPVEVCFTTDIALDAKRRDFTCNAVYYNIKEDCTVDPLNGVSAIQNKQLVTVAPAEKVFGEDGLRLMRLARQAAQLGFQPNEECLLGAQQNASLILDITPERIFTELHATLYADKKYGVKDGHYQGIVLLEKIGVLEKIIPELTLGKGMVQRSDFHRYDVFQHSLHALLYSPETIRFAALLHDVGKPYCILKDGNSYGHAVEGERIVGEILTRLKAPKRLIAQTQALVKWHMYDFNSQTSENKLRKFFVEYYPLLNDLLDLKQADFSGCKDNLSPAPTCVRGKGILQQMQEENAPLTLKQLAVSGKDLQASGIPAPLLSQILHRLLTHSAIFPNDNKKQRLIKLAHSFLKSNES